MPRPKVPGAPEPKRRSRHGCWSCKAKKVKCGEEKPRCQNCERNGEVVCDYSIRLQWDGRFKRKGTSTPEPSESSASMGRNDANASLQSIQLTGISGTFAVSGSPAMHEASFATAESSRAAHAFATRPLLPESDSSYSYASPSESTNDTGSPRYFDDPSPFQHSSMPPPLPPDPIGKNPTFDFSGSVMSSTHPSKKSRQTSAPIPRLKTEGAEQPHLRAHHYSITSGMSPRPVTAISSAASSSIGMGDLAGLGFPLTPSASSVTSEDYQSNPARTSPLLPPNVLDPRRLSVNSLLMQEESNTEKAYEYFGVDRGFPDLDMPANDDSRALDIITPVLGQATFSGEQRRPSGEFGFGLFGEDSSTTSNCYAEPLHVKISTSLLPLPPLLLQNPMNLMYFHFFIEYTARILVPHDCPANPFKTVLPQMAIRDENLLKLLLAYSASHRARLLRHPIPSNRIALLVSEVFPSLRRALKQPPRQISDANVATAIMLASLEIIAPSTFGIGVAWQDHLRVARRMIVARGGARAVDWRRDRVSYFLVRWFAYLDVLGSFTSTVLTAAATQQDAPMFTADLYDFGRENDFQIDCLLGFSGRLAGILAAIADLARACDARRAQFADPDRWRPDAATVARARQIQAELAAAREQPHAVCPHQGSSGAGSSASSSATTDSSTETAWVAAEMAATNDAFHWAGALHLLRRVLGRPRADPDVQHAVHAVVDAMARVRRGGSAEACVLFPLVSAGCEARDDAQRAAILDRVRSVEASGMTQVQRARRLLESVWATGRPWESLVQGEEFFG